MPDDKNGDKNQVERQEKQDSSDPAERADAEVARISRTVVPGADAPSRAGISGPGSGADSERS